MLRKTVFALFNVASIVQECDATVDAIQYKSRAHKTPGFCITKTLCRLHVKTKMHNVSIFYQVIFTLYSKLAIVSASRF